MNEAEYVVEKDTKETRFAILIKNKLTQTDQL